jgi:hypothetical protein
VKHQVPNAVRWLVGPPPNIVLRHSFQAVDELRQEVILEK